MSQLPELIDLYGEFESRGLRLIGVNVDSDMKRIRDALDTYEMPWPQYFDARGFENEVLVQTGVVEIPTCFVVDRKGILRNIGDCDSLRPVIVSLLDSPD
jgi:alkyl hydroperoxide reductase subunit AhpC